MTKSDEEKIIDTLDRMNLFDLINDFLICIDRLMNNIGFKDKELFVHGNISLILNGEIGDRFEITTNGEGFISYGKETKEVDSRCN
jgi:hypothetical protein